MLPASLRKYFWEVDATKVDVQKRAYYVIERLLEYGDAPATHWLFRTYPKERIIEVLKKSRSLSKKSANFWALVLNISKREILCLSKQFQKTSRAIWRY